MTAVGLRVDVDTFSGTRDGVPRLLDLFARHNVKATFFFSMGPDNMGRHLWRLLRPAFLKKMLRSNAPSLYGWDILLAGTAWPGRRIAPHTAGVIRRADDEGHELGLHAWDHHAWQMHMEDWPLSRLEREIRLGLEALEAILGRKVDCSAAPGWRVDERVLEMKEAFAFRYNSDCRAEAPFLPVLPGGRDGTAQIPVSLPTFDEAVGERVDEAGFNDFILDAMLACTGVPVYTIHAEVEGVSRSAMFEELLMKIQARDIVFCPLGELLPGDPGSLQRGRVRGLPFPGREGCLGCRVT